MWQGDFSELREVLSSMEGFFDGEEDVDGATTCCNARHTLSVVGPGPSWWPPPWSTTSAAPLPFPVPTRPYRTSERARNGSRDRTSNKVAWLVEAHVPAKVFLAGSDPAYLGALSPASVSSLGFQRIDEADLAPRALHRAGGPKPYSRGRWDDAAKVPGAVTASVQEVLPGTGARPECDWPGTSETKLLPEKGGWAGVGGMKGGCGRGSRPIGRFGERPHTGGEAR